MSEPAGKRSVSAVVITLDEQERIETCLRSLDWVDEIVLVDGGSKDRTLDIASKYTQRIYQRKFNDFSSQKNYAVDQATKDWILSIDADEFASIELKEEVQKAIARDTRFNGFFVRRTNFIFGRRLRFGGQASEKILRLFKRGRGKFEQPIHERLVVESPLGELRGSLIHYSSSSVEKYLRKLSVYTDLEVCWMKELGIRPSLFNLYIKPLLAFFYRYCLLLGFLDGFEGFLFHSLSSFNLFFKYIRLKEGYDEMVQASL